MNVPVTVYAEMTPNPSTMKFVANKYLLITGDSVEFSSKADAKGYSPMAEELFNFPFVKNVFVAANSLRLPKRIMFLGISSRLNCVSLLKTGLPRGKTY